MKGWGLGRMVRAWFRRQMYSLFSSLGALVKHPFGTLMTVLVLAVAMVLPLGLHFALRNLDGLELHRSEWAALSVFLKESVTREQALALAARVDSRADARAIAISPEQSMEEFRVASGLGSGLDLLDTNPLPWMLQVSPEAAEAELDAAADALSAWLNGQAEVESVSADFKWLQRLSAMLELGKALVHVLAFLFSLAVIVVVANTIRLDVANRASEIEVLSLVGAGNGFIRQPFLYAGLWYGLMGSLLALLLLQVCLGYLQKPLESLAEAYGSGVGLLRPDSIQSALVVLSGGVLGLLGAWLSVHHYLRLLRRYGRLQGV